MPPDKLPNSAEADRDRLQRVNGFLHQRGYRPHRTLVISAERGVVVVQGRIPTFYLRQIAVECIKRVAGVTQVVDLIEVADEHHQNSNPRAIAGGNDTMAPQLKRDVFDPAYADCLRT